MNYPEHVLKEILEKNLEPFFELIPEVEVFWSLNSQKPRIDYVARPKENAKSLGFEFEQFGIEVKSPISNESTKKSLDCIFQSHSYTLATFLDKPIDFVLMFPDIEKFFQYDNAVKYKGKEEFTRREVRITRRIMQRANVGELILKKNGHFVFDFEGGPLFSSDKGRSNIKGIGLNRYFGSAKSR
jgi:hypothetical protein